MPFESTPRLVGWGRSRHRCRRPSAGGSEAGPLSRRVPPPAWRRRVATDRTSAAPDARANRRARRRRRVALLRAAVVAQACTAARAPAPDGGETRHVDAASVRPAASAAAAIAAAARPRRCWPLGTRGVATAAVRAAGALSRRPSDCHGQRQRCGHPQNTVVAASSGGVADVLRRPPQSLPRVCAHPLPPRAGTAACPPFHGEIRPLPAGRGGTGRPPPQGLPSGARSCASWGGCGGARGRWPRGAPAATAAGRCGGRGRVGGVWRRVAAVGRPFHCGTKKPGTRRGAPPPAHRDCGDGPPGHATSAGGRMHGLELLHRLLLSWKPDEALHLCRAIFSHSGASRTQSTFFLEHRRTCPIRHLRDCASWSSISDAPTSILG